MQMAGFSSVVKNLSDDEEIEKILDSFPELNYGAVGYYEITALQVAAAFTKNDVTDRIKRLVLYEDIINRGDQLGRTPLHYAALNGNADLVEFFLDLGANTECKLQYHETNVKTTHENYSKWNKLYTMLPPPDGWGRVPLHLAVKYGHSDVVRILIDGKANVNAEDDKGVTPLLLAGSNKSKESFESIVEVLLENGACVNKRNCVTGTTALFHAVTLNNTKATKDLLKSGAWISEGVCQQTELHEAAANGYIEILHLILDDVRIKKEDINKVDIGNRTPTYKAAYGGHKECLKLLIERGGDLGHMTKINETIMDAIFAHITRPAAFVRELLDDRINMDYLQDNDENFSITLDFSILAPCGNDKQMNVTSNILVAASEAEKIEIFQHPLIETFLRLKWFKIRQFFFLLIYSYVFFVLSLSTYIVLRNYEKYFVWMSVMRYFVIISSGGLMQHALIQLILVPRNFFRQYEVWMNLTCTSLSLLVALIGNEALTDYDANSTPNWILHATSIAVLLAWTELMLLIGRFPTYGYYALMFAAVLQNVIKVLLTFVCLVLGFAISFSIQFYKDGQFNDPWCALVKTTVMMMGEFEYEGLFDNDETKLNRLPTTSRVIFLIFVILASIVLMNLMIGLAVSDIQGLQQEGYVRRLEKQAEFLRQLEKVISFKAIDSKWFPSLLRKFLKGKRCIATTLVIQSKFYDKKKRDKRLPSELVDSIKNIARKKHRDDVENLPPVNIIHLIEMMKNFIKAYENKLKN